MIYDLFGNVIESNDGKGTTYKYEYSANGQLSAISSSKGQKSKFYTKGNVIYEVDEKGNKRQISCNGKIIFEKYKNGTIKKYNILEKDKYPVTILPNGNVVNSKYTKQWKDAYESFSNSVSFVLKQNDSKTPAKTEFQNKLKKLKRKYKFK
ncbi:hypothetical protein IJ182_09620 [bacterium]|nr:hypothetical protein [bacterium]